MNLQEQYKFVYHAAATSLNWRPSRTVAYNPGQSTAPVVGESDYYNVGPHPGTSASGADDSQLRIYANMQVPVPVERKVKPSAAYDGKNVYENCINV